MAEPEPPDLGTVLLDLAKPVAEPTFRWFNPLPQGRHLNATHALHGKHVWAVGDNGIILNWNGSAWSLHESGTRNQLLGVWAVDEKTAWAVGALGTIV